MSGKDKVISIKRYRPLWDVIRADWNDDWSDDKKMEAIITGGDNPSHIQSCVDADVLSVRIVLNRLNEFISDTEPPPDYAFDGGGFDMDSMKIPLKRSIKAIDDLLLETPHAATKKIEKLLLLMFELGSKVGSINNQDLIFKGMESIKKPYRGGLKNGKGKKEIGDIRKKAYLNAMNAAEKAGFKSTAGGLRYYLKSLKGERFDTGFSECGEIWIDEKNNFVDSLGRYSESSVSKLKGK